MMAMFAAAPLAPERLEPREQEEGTLARHARPPAHEPSAGPAATDAEHGAESCVRCDGRGTCRSCAQRRKHAWRLVVVGGLSYVQAAARMKLTAGRVRLLVAQERDHRELKEFKLNRLDDRVRARVRRPRARARPVADAR